MLEIITSEYLREHSSKLYEELSNSFRDVYKSGIKLPYDLIINKIIASSLSSAVLISHGFKYEPKILIRTAFEGSPIQVASAAG